MKILKKISFHLLITSIFIVPALVHSQPAVPSNNRNNPVPSTNTNNPIPSTNSNTNFNFQVNNPFDCGKSNRNECDLFSLIRAVLSNVIMPIAAVGIVLYIIYAGFLFVTAQGKPKEIETAKEALLWGLIGGGVILGAAGIATVIENTINSLK